MRPYSYSDKRVFARLAHQNPMPGDHNWWVCVAQCAVSTTTWSLHSSYRRRFLLWIECTPNTQPPMPTTMSDANQNNKAANMTPINLFVVPPSPPCRAVIIAAKYMKINVNLIYVDLMKGHSLAQFCPAFNNCLH